MSTAATASGPLAPACQQVLDENEASATPSMGGLRADIYDCDGKHLFSVTSNIHSHDLHTLFLVDRRRFNEGVRAGREEAYAGLRALIGAAAQEAS